MNAINAKGQAVHPRKEDGKPQGPKCICGKTGAMWLLIVEGEVPKRVHRPCGLAIADSAPKDTLVKVVPSRDLRNKWNQAKLVKDFWSAKLDEASAKAKKT